MTVTKLENKMTQDQAIALRNAMYASVQTCEDGGYRHNEVFVSAFLVAFPGGNYIYGGKDFSRCLREWADAFEGISK